MTGWLVMWLCSFVNNLIVLSLWSQNVVRFSAHIPPLTSISALTLSPLLGAKICLICYTTGTIGSSSIERLSICDLGLGLNSKQRQRQDTNGFGCKLHLLTLTHQHRLHLRRQNCREELWRIILEKNPIIIKIPLMTLHSNIFIFSIKSHNLSTKLD